MVRGKREANLAVRMQLGTHELVSGLSGSLGGNDEGPDPHLLIEASLAACTILTVQLYANRKNWPLKSTEVNVQIEKEGAESLFVRKIAFVGDLSDEQRARLLEIADKCPIHKLLESSIKVETRVVDAGSI